MKFMVVYLGAGNSLTCARTFETLIEAQRWMAAKIHDYPASFVIQVIV